MDVLDYNRHAWNRQVDLGNEWTVPVDSDAIRAARKGSWSILLTPTIPVPHSWFPPLKEAEVLCLAASGGQQGPVLSAAGARVTAFDNSDRQLAQDRIVAVRDKLDIHTVQGDMADLSAFDNASFDLIVHPVSNLFVPDVKPVWREAFRVLRSNGLMLSGMVNPLLFLFEWEELVAGGTPTVRYRLPYSDLEQRAPAALKRQQENRDPLEYGHTLDDLIGGQLEAGFLLEGFYEDRFAGKDNIPIAGHICTFFATKSRKKPDHSRFQSTPPP